MCCAFTIIGIVSVLTMILAMNSTKIRPQNNKVDSDWTDLGWTKNLLKTKPDFPYYGLTRKGVKDMNKELWEDSTYGGPMLRPYRNINTNKDVRLALEVIVEAIKVKKDGWKRIIILDNMPMKFEEKNDTDKDTITFFNVWMESNNMTHFSHEQLIYFNKTEIGDREINNRYTFENLKKFLNGFGRIIKFHANGLDKKNQYPDPKATDLCKMLDVSEGVFLNGTLNGSGRKLLLDDTVTQVIIFKAQVGFFRNDKLHGKGL